MNVKRIHYELMVPATSDPESLIEDMWLIDAMREASLGRDLCERSPLRHRSSNDTDPEARHRLGNHLKPD